MTHEEFVAAYGEGRIVVGIDKVAAARLVSRRLLLPFVLLPLLGLSVALALTGWLISGIALFIATVAFRYFVRSSSRGFVLSQALRNTDFYRQAIETQLIIVTERP